MRTVYSVFWYKVDISYHAHTHSSVHLSSIESIALQFNVKEFRYSPLLLVYIDNSLSFDHFRTLGETTTYLLKWSKQV